METDSLFPPSHYRPAQCHPDRGFPVSAETSPAHLSLQLSGYSRHNVHEGSHGKKEELDLEDESRGLLYDHTASADSVTYLSRFIHIMKHSNGGATLVHMDEEEYKHLSDRHVEQLADLFLQEVFREEPKGVASHVMGVVHNAARHLPELVTYFEEAHPNVIVKMGHLRKSEIETTNFAGFASKVRSSYCNGTFRCGPLLQVSCVGQVAEEAGRYFPEFLGVLNWIV